MEERPREGTVCAQAGFVTIGKAGPKAGEDSTPSVLIVNLSILCYDDRSGRYILVSRRGVWFLFETMFLCVALADLGALCRPGWPQTYKDLLPQPPEI